MLETRKVARWLSSTPQQLDAAAHTQEDYESLLTYRLWAARLRFVREHPEASDAQMRKYTYTCVLNAARDLAKSRGRYPDSVPFLDDYAATESPENEVACRELLAHLKARLTPTQWGILGRLMDAQGSVTEAYDAQADGATLGAFYKRVSQLRQAVRQTLGEE